MHEVASWKRTDTRPVELLRGMTDIVAPDSDGDTVALYLKQSGDGFRLPE